MAQVVGSAHAVKFIIKARRLMNTGKIVCMYIFMAAIVLILPGCASSPEKLEFSMPVPDSENLVWPSPPDVPRYRYLGELTGEQNLKEESVDTSGLQTFFRWIVGLDSLVERPNVLQRPNNGIRGQDGKIYVTDISRQSVIIFDEALGKIDVWDSVSNGVGFKSPIALAILNGEVLVSDSGWGKVFRLGKNGKVTGSIGKEVLNRPTGIAVDGKRHIIYVADTGDHNIKVFDFDGEMIDLIGSKGDQPGQFNAPTFLAYQDDILYISDTLNARIQMFLIEDKVFKSVGTRGLYVGNMARPKGISLDDNGNLYVIESYYDHLLIYNREGRFLLAIGGSGSGPGQFFQPSGVWVDEHNRVFVSDMLNGRVSVFQYLGEN